MSIDTLPLRGRLDSASTPRFEREMLDFLGDGSGAKLLDCAALDYISSAGLRLMLMAAKRVEAGGGRLIAVALNEQVSEVFEISGFNSIFEIFPDRESALATL